MRDLILLIDVSTNALDVWPTVTACVRNLLRPLQNGDRFALVGFNQDLTGYLQGIFAPATDVAEGLRWLAQVKPAGQADMTIVLSRIATIQPEHTRRMQVVTVLSGPIAGELPESWPERIRLDLIGIGDDTAGPLEDLAVRTGGGGQWVQPGDPLESYPLLT